jgi:hypothetical protein
MDANILCTLLAQRIPPEQFQILGLEIYFIDPDENSKPVDAPHTSPYDTPANRAIVEDVIANYDTLAAAYIPDPPVDLLGDIASWVATQPNPPQSVVAAVAMKAQFNKGIG